MAEMKYALADRSAEIPTWLEVIRLGRRDGRILDSRIETSDPARLLGFVERLSTRRYEVLWMTGAMRWGSVAGAFIASPDPASGPIRSDAW